MDTITQICNVLEEKKERFLEYEQATLALLDGDVDAAEHYITERGRIATEIDELDEKIARLSGDVPGGELLLDAAAARSKFDCLPSEYQCVFYAGQAVRSVAGRVAESEKQVMARFEALRSEARAHIRQNQNLPKIKKYLTDLADKPDEAPLTDGKA